MNPGDLPLRDIHLPPAIGWWPLAPGWWMLAVLVTVAIVGGVFLRVHLARRRRRLGRWLDPELQRVGREFAASGDSRLMLQEISALLRRACLSLFPRQSVAGLVQEQWLGLLDEIGETDQFTSGPGRLLASAPYEPDPDPASAQAVLELAQRWASHCSQRLIRDQAP